MTGTTQRRLTNGLRSPQFSTVSKWCRSGTEGSSTACWRWGVPTSLWRGSPRDTSTPSGSSLRRHESRSRDVWYGVWASRSQQTGLRAESGPDGLRVEGTLRFASGAGVLDRALIPVWLPDGRHLLLDLDVTDLPVDPTVWRTGAMQASRTYELTVADLRVGQESVVGEPDFYLGRPGFFPGGVGVAACWAGGAARVLDLLRARHPHPTLVQQLRLGRMRTELIAAVAAARSAADVLDWQDPSTDLQQVATEARAVTAEAIRRLLAEARLVTGPAGLALDDGISHAVPDLELYVLQQNSDGDAALLGDPEGQP